LTGRKNRKPFYQLKEIKMFKKLARIIAIALLLVGTVTLPALAASPHSISGTVTLNGAALKGVTVTIKGTSYHAVTNGLGNYNIASVPAGTTGTLVPSLVNYSFTPASIKFAALNASLTGQNFQAKLSSTKKYSISGAIKVGGVALAGVTVSFASQSAVTNSSGVYEISNVPAGSTSHIVPVLTGYSFTPTYITVSNLSANLSHQSFTAAVALSVSGVVTDQATGLPLGGVLVTLGTLSAVSNATTGAYNIRNVPVGTTDVLTPSLSGETFTPPTIAINNLLASVHSQNFVAVP
jgi:CarboxypepD_reg-like domain